MNTVTSNITSEAKATDSINYRRDLRRKQELYKTRTDVMGNLTT